MVWAWILIALPVGLRPVRALRVRGRTVPKPSTVTRLPLATLWTMASNTAFTASPAAALLTLPAFAATSTRSDFVTTCGMRSPRPLTDHRIQIEIEIQRDCQRAVIFLRGAHKHLSLTARRNNHAAVPSACAHRARGRRFRVRACTDNTDLLELGAADAPSHHLA